MDNPRSSSGNGEDYGIPDDLRCKRTDGKQWRCTARSMPDKTVCEKHYIQAKKRAANSALRASLKKAKRNSLDDNELYSENRNDDLDMSPSDALDYPISVLAKKHKDQCEENERFYRTPPSFSMETSPSRPENISDEDEAEEYSDGNSDSSDDSVGQPCHQCRRNDRDGVVWCLKCDKRGYCGNCISRWYLEIPLDDIERACPACLGICTCKSCLRLRAENLIKVRIREIPVQNKLLYLFYVLSSVLPIVKKIHKEHCSEVDLETRVHGKDLSLSRRKLSADEQMCCNFCRMPIVDYHRHCGNCSYDLCLSCCKELREASLADGDGDKAERDQPDGIQDKESMSEQVSVTRTKLIFSDKYPDWKADNHGSIPCPPREYGGCGSTLMSLCRIFKMNWVAKLVKNSEEMVSGCKVYDACAPQSTELNDSRFRQLSHREDSDDNLLYSPASDYIKTEGFYIFRRQWLKGQPVIVSQVCDNSSSSAWDPAVIRREVQEIADKKSKTNKLVKAISCLNWSEVNIELDQFIKEYFVGRIHESGRPEMLKLKNWPSPSVAEEFLSCRKTDFISELPLLEYVHSKWGLLNVAAKLPYYTLQNDVGPKLLISHGVYDELGEGDSVIDLHFKMTDMMYLLLHAHKVELKDQQMMTIEKIQNDLVGHTENESEAPQANEDDDLPQKDINEDFSHNLNDDDLPRRKDVDLLPEFIDAESAENNRDDELCQRDKDEDLVQKNTGKLHQNNVDEVVPQRNVIESLSNKTMDEDLPQKNLHEVHPALLVCSAKKEDIELNEREKAVIRDQEIETLNIENESPGNSAKNECDTGLNENKDAVMKESEIDTVSIEERSPAPSGYSAKNEYDTELPKNNGGVIGDPEIETTNTEEKSSAISEIASKTECDSKLTENEDAVIGEPEIEAANTEELFIGKSAKNEYDTELADKKDNPEIETFNIEESSGNIEPPSKNSTYAEKIYPGALWDVFRRQDVPKLIQFMKLYRQDIRGLKHGIDESVDHMLYDEAVYLNERHKSILREKFGVESWSFEQCIGQAVFIPAGCPFQVRNLQSTVQFSLDFLSPESLGVADKMSEEIRLLPNDHEVKLKMLEVGKTSLYAASSAIKEVQKLVLDPKHSEEVELEDPNLTKMVSDNLDKIKLQPATCG